MRDDRFVLILENNDDLADTLAECLGSDGYSTHRECNGREGLNFLESCNPMPSLIVVDLSMPVMDGKTFRSLQLQDDRIASIPVLFWTTLWSSLLDLKIDNKCYVADKSTPLPEFRTLVNSIIRSQ